MKTKLVRSLILAASLTICTSVLCQTSTMTGTVMAVSAESITIQQGTTVWVIKRTSTTQVTSGDLKAGSTVTVKYSTPDAQKKEGPVTAGEPTPTPAAD